MGTLDVYQLYFVPTFLRIIPKVLFFLEGIIQVTLLNFAGKKKKGFEACTNNNESVALHRPPDRW